MKNNSVLVLWKFGQSYKRRSQILVPYAKPDTNPNPNPINPTNPNPNPNSCTLR